MVLVLKENNNNNKEVPWDYWFIIITNPSQTNPEPNFIFDLLSKDKFLFSVSKPLSRCSECVPLAATPILMVDCYWNPWRKKLYMSQGLLNYSHVSQPLSKFTCSNIKAPLLKVGKAVLLVARAVPSLWLGEWHIFVPYFVFSSRISS